jgi:hypothetical protein
MIQSFEEITCCWGWWLMDNRTFNMVGDSIPAHKRLPIEIEIWVKWKDSYEKYD